MASEVRGRRFQNSSTMEQDCSIASPGLVAPVRAIGFINPAETVSHYHSSAFAMVIIRHFVG